MATDSEMIQHLLGELGLGQTEAIVYEFGARQKHPVRAQEVQRHTGLKRPTVYYALEQLAAKGLVSSTKTEVSTEFTFQPPHKLENMVNDEVRQAKAKLHSVAKLIDLFPLQSVKDDVSVSHFEGLQGVKTVIDMTLYCKDKKWQVIAPFKNFLRDYDEQYSRYYVYTKRKQGIKTETLWETIIPGSRVLSASEIKEKNPRIMPDTMAGRFGSILIIFDNKVAIIGPITQMSAIVIESTEVVAMFRGLFETVWDISTPYKVAITKA